MQIRIELFMLFVRNPRIEYIVDEILDQYLYADTTFRPWIIGFSGGKDSTVLLTLVWLALQKIKETTPAQPSATATADASLMN